MKILLFLSGNISIRILVFIITKDRRPEVCGLFYWKKPPAAKRVAIAYLK